MKDFRLCFFVFFVCMLALSSCHQDEDVIIQIQGQNLSVGNFYAINRTNNDTVIIRASVESNKGTLNAKNGDVVQLQFKPDEDYADLTFDVSYKLYDDTTLKGQELYYNSDFVISNTDIGTKEITMTATHKEGSNGQLKYIKSTSTLYLNVTE